MFTATIPVDILKASLMFASEKDVRYYLMGVHLELTPTGAFCVATNGHVASVAHLQSDMCNGAGSAIIPRDACEQAIRAAGKASHITAHCEDDGAVRLEVNGAMIGCKAVEGRFPDWRRVFPRTFDVTKPSHLDPAYIRVAHRAWEALRMRKGGIFPGIASNGEAANLCILRDDMAAIIMPRRDMAPDHLEPDWVHA